MGHFQQSKSIHSPIHSLQLVSPYARQLTRLTVYPVSLSHFIRLDLSNYLVWLVVLYLS